MTVSRFIALAVAAILILAWASAGAAPKPGKLYRLARKYSHNDRYKIPDNPELETFKSCCREILAGAADDGYLVPQSLKDKFLALNFVVSSSRNPDKTPLIVIHEIPGKRFGGGIYFLAPSRNRERPVLLQTPHGRSDAFTGLLTMNAFTTGEYMGLFSSTMRRDAPSDAMDETMPVEVSSPTPETSGEDDADLTHQSSSYFQAFTEVMTEFYPGLMVVQIHGFVRNEDPERQYEMIVSAGLPPAEQPEKLRRLQHIFKTCLPDRRIAVFGQDTSVLGALTNVQADHIYNRSGGVFIHLELSDDYRKELMEKKDSADRFFKCLKALKVMYEHLEK